MYVAHLLSNWSGVGSCAWPMSSRAWRIDIISFPFMNHAPLLASCADDITALIILDTASIAPLWVDSGELGRMEKEVSWLRYMMP